MATVKLTIKQGQHAKDVVQAVGAVIAGSDAVEVNVDVTDMTKGQFRQLLKELDAYVHANKVLPFVK